MKKRTLLAALLISLLITSCGLNNIMYNARKYFKQAQARPLNSNGKPSPQAVEEYTKTIQKCGMILTEKKKGKVVGEALFLLAKALYYKGNSAFQAKDQFEAFIAGFPDSPQVPDAYLYLARVLRQLNRPADSEKLLEGFVRDSRYQKHHPRALMVLAEFEIGDKDYLRAQYWLQRIIDDYPRTPEFKEAFFLFGKNYYEQQDYRASYREFEKLVNTRGISKELKLEGRYYMALSLFEQGETDKSYRLVTALLKEESRPEKLGQIRILKARLLLAGDKPEQGIEEVEAIGKAYPRSMSSAAANYYLGDYYFYREQDLAKATTAYNKVRTEFPSSTLVPDSQLKSNALTQLGQNKSLSAQANLQQFIDYHILAAENYMNAFALNDSALVMYDRILVAPAPMQAELDSLLIQFHQLEAQSDSLRSEIESLEAELATLKQERETDAKIEKPQEEKKDETPEASDDKPEPPADDKSESEELNETEPSETQDIYADEELTELETSEIQDISIDEQLTETEPPELQELPADEELTELETSEIQDISIDEELTEAALPEDNTSEDQELPTQKEPDTSELKQDEPPAPPEEKPQAPPPVENREEQEKSTQLTGLKSQQQELDISIAGLDSRIKGLQGNLTRFDTEFIPLVSFAKASLLQKMQVQPEIMQNMLQSMEESFPDNKYTNAMRMLLAGEPVRLVDAEEDRQAALLDSALGMYPEHPDSMLVVLEELTQSVYPQISLKANFRLGWFYTFDQPDTLSAKPYLNEVVKHSQPGDYGTFTNKFYDGKNFQFPKPKPDSSAVSDSMAIDPEKEDSQPEQKPEIKEPESGLESDALPPDTSEDGKPEELPPPETLEPDGKEKPGIESEKQESPPAETSVIDESPPPSEPEEEAHPPAPEPDTELQTAPAEDEEQSPESETETQESTIQEQETELPPSIPEGLELE